MLDYWKGFCQWPLKYFRFFASFIGLLALVSCAVMEHTLVHPTIFWNEPGQKNQFPRYDGSPYPHLFFDHLPFIDIEKNELNMVITTPSAGPNRYGVDFVSGQRYLVARHCEQSDAWYLAQRKFERPNFSEGIVPRLLNQEGQMQRAIVFGRDDFFKTMLDNGNEEKIYASVRARVIGAVLEQFCPYTSCQDVKSWVSSLLFIAVDPEDSRYDSVFNLEDLKNYVDWNYSKSFLELAKGRYLDHPEDVKGRPAWRILGEIPAKEAMEYSLKNGHLFEVQKLKSIKRSCERLYNQVWNEFLEMVLTNLKDKEQLAQDNKMNMSKKKQSLPSVDRYKLDVSLKLSGNIEKQVEDKNKMIHIGASAGTKEQVNRPHLGKFLEKLFDKDKRSLATCFRYVRAANIEEEAERSWFFAYLQNLVQLDQLGHGYDCQSKSWFKKDSFSSKDKKEKEVNSFKNCSEASANESMELAISYMTGLASSGAPHYRYITWDFGYGGSHAKIYNWVYSVGTKQACLNPKYRINFSIFPEDQRWDKLVNRLDNKN